MSRAPLGRLALAVLPALLVTFLAAPASAAPIPARVAIASPGPGQAVGGVIQISIAYDAGPVVRELTAITLSVEDGVLYSGPLATGGGRGVEFLPLDTRRLANGRHVLRVTAHAGPDQKVVAEDSLPIHISNGGLDTIPPVVAIRDYQDGDVVSGTIYLEVVATDNDQVSRLAIWVNGGPVAITTPPAYGVHLNTARYADPITGRGEMRVQAWAYDRSNNLGQSRVVTLQVDQRRNLTPLREDPAAGRLPATRAADPPAGVGQSGLPRLARLDAFPEIARGPRAAAPAVGLHSGPVSSHRPVLGSLTAPRRASLDAFPEIARDYRLGMPTPSQPRTGMQLTGAAGVSAPRRASLDAFPEIARSLRGGPPITERPQARGALTTTGSGAPRPLGATHQPEVAAQLRATAPALPPLRSTAVGDARGVTPREARDREGIQAARELRLIPPEIAGPTLGAASVGERPGAPPALGPRVARHRIDVALGGVAGARPVARPSVPEIEPRSIEPDHGAVPEPLVILPTEPVEPPTAAAFASESSYTVQRGDTLWAIAHDYGVSPRSIRVASGLPDEGPLEVGMELVVPGTFHVALGDETLKFDVLPRVEGGVPFAPFRQIFEHTGGQVFWIRDRQEVIGRKPGSDVTFRIGSQEAFLNGETLLLDAATFLESGRAMVPIRFIEQLLDMKAEYDARSGTVYFVRE